MPRGGEEFGAWWDERSAQAACDFFATRLRHTEGEWAGKPFILADWQRDRIIRPTYGWKRADGSRLIRIVWIEVPRKNGKTELAAGVSLLALLGDGEMGGQVFSIAVDKKQAELVFKKAGVMAGMSAPLLRHLEVLTTSIFCQQLNAAFRPLSGNPHGKHGLSASGVIGDEVHEWKSGELADVVHKSTAARRQPLEFYITTGGVAGQGYPWDMHELALQVLAGEVIDPTFLPIIFAAPPDADFRLESSWRTANPNYGVSVKPDYMAAEAAKAARSPRAENEFRRFHLNQWTEQVTRWLPMADPGWRACTAEPANPVLWQALATRLKGRRCYSALDLALTSDVTALCHCFPPDDDLPFHTFLWRFWLPEGAIERATQPQQVRYDSFRRAGALAVTPGNITDYGFVRREIVADAEAYDMAWLGVDPFNASELMLTLKDDDGLPVQHVRQGTLTMSPPSKGFERLVMGNAIEHGNNPVATWMARNAVVLTDAKGNITPDKARAMDKIDGIVAAIMAYAGATFGRTAPPAPSIYETRGLQMVG